MIVMLLLTNGEEVFGELLGENDRGIDLDNALAVNYTTIDGNPTIIFRKYCTYSNNFDIFFKREHIIAVFKDLREEIIKSYMMSVELYDGSEITTFTDSGGILEFDPDFDIEPDFDEGDYDSIFYTNNKKTIH